MADNRMYIRCKGCGETLFLAKLSVGAGWFGVKPGAEKGEELEEFIGTHDHCCNFLDEAACGGVNPYAHEFEPFELDYEMHDDFMHRLCYQERQRQIDLGLPEDLTVLEQVNIQKPMNALHDECWDAPKPLCIDIHTIAVNYSSGLRRFQEHPLGDRRIGHDWGLIMEIMSIVQHDKVKPTEAGECPDLLVINKALAYMTLQRIDLLSDGSACVWIYDGE